MLFHWNSVVTFCARRCQNEKGHWEGGTKYSGFTVTFVPFLKYAWGHWFPSCDLLRLLPPFIFPGRRVYIKCSNESMEWGLEVTRPTPAPGKQGLALLPQCCPQTQPHCFLLQMPRLLREVWHCSGKRVHLLFFKSDFSPTHSLISSHTDFLAVLDTPDTFPATGLWFCCSLCLERFPNPPPPDGITGHSTTSYGSLRRSHFLSRFYPSHPTVLLSLYFHILHPCFLLLFLLST